MRETLTQMRTYSLACEASGCGNYYVNSGESMTRKFARSLAKSAGWRIRKDWPVLCDKCNRRKINTTQKEESGDD